MNPPSPWKRPSEVMQLHKLKKRKLALQERMKQPLSSTSDETSSQNTAGLDFSRLLDGEKRKNPFSKSQPQPSKKTKVNIDTDLDPSNDKTLFALLKLPAKVADKPSGKEETDKLSTFSNLLQKYTAEHTVETVIPEKKYKRLPIDWALKTKVKLMSPKPFPWTSKLKASEEASGITGFVRCLDTSSSPTLDTSPRARFHQTCLYWQHPHLPWLELFPRSALKVSANNVLNTNVEIRDALHREWTESFRSVFQLVRARHCPYFYVCANAFTAVFLAAGVCGGDEPCALLTPTTSGLRHTLRQEDIEFTMPLRTDGKKRLNTSEEDKPKNSSFDSCYDTMDDARAQDEEDKESGDEDPDQFLSQLGLENEVIKKINNTQARVNRGDEQRIDRSRESLLAARGADAQALFNWLLNCRSTAQLPPTLLAPIAFHGAALQSLKVRESVVYAGSHKYFAVEVRGPVLPTSLSALLRVLRGRAEHSAAAQHAPATRAFTDAVRALADESTKENEPNHFTKAFDRENLSDCGLNEEMLQQLCSPDPNFIQSIDGVKYNPEDDTYTW